MAGSTRGPVRHEQRDLRGNASYRWHAHTCHRCLASDPNSSCGPLDAVPSALLGLGLVVAFLILAAVGPWIVPYPQDALGKIDLAQRLLPPSLAHVRSVRTRWATTS